MSEWGEPQMEGMDADGGVNGEGLLGEGDKRKPLPGVGAAEGVWSVRRMSGAFGGYLGPKA